RGGTAPDRSLLSPDGRQRRRVVELRISMEFPRRRDGIAAAAIEPKGGDGDEDPSTTYVVKHDSRTTCETAGDHWNMFTRRCTLYRIDPNAGSAVEKRRAHFPWTREVERHDSYESVR